MKTSRPTNGTINDLELLVSICTETAGESCRWCINEDDCRKEYDRAIDAADGPGFNYEYSKGRLLRVLVHHPDYAGGQIRLGI